MTHSADFAQPVFAMFNSICLAGAGDKAKIENTATELNWTKASDVDLSNGGLKQLRKTILDVPGGGARVSETQSIFMNADSVEPTFLSVEERLVQGIHVATSCTIFQKSEDLLPVCTEIGRMLKKSPDTNRKYKNSGSHFISWKLRIWERPATVFCQRAPKATLLPYPGISIALKVDHSKRAKIKAAKTIVQADR